MHKNNLLSGYGNNVFSQVLFCYSEWVKFYVPRETKQRDVVSDDACRGHTTQTVLSVVNNGNELLVRRWLWDVCVSFSVISHDLWDWMMLTRRAVFFYRSTTMTLTWSTSPARSVYITHHQSFPWSRPAWYLPLPWRPYIHPASSPLTLLNNLS